MKMFFDFSITLSVIVLVSAVCEETVAQYQPGGQAGQAPPRYAQPVTSPAQQTENALTKEQAAKIEASLARLSPEDRQLAEAQAFCPIMLKNRLGVMGPPVKVMVNKQPVFVCCKGCAQKALANPTRTLAIVDQLKARTAEAEINASLSKLSPEDRQLAQAQGYCPVMRENRLGVMGPPVKLIIEDKPVFLCCAGCKRKAFANPQQTLAVVAELKAKVAEEAARQARAGRERPRQQ